MGSPSTLGGGSCDESGLSFLFCIQGSAAVDSVTKPRASMAAPVQRSKPTPTFAFVLLALKVDTVKTVRKKQVDCTLPCLIHVDVIFCQCARSKVPQMFMRLKFIHC